MSFAHFLAWFRHRCVTTPYTSQVEEIEVFDETDLLRRHNLERSKRKIEPLHRKPKLSILAMDRAAKAADAELTREHLHDGFSRVPGAHKTGENADMGQANADQAMESWMSSSDHRLNVLDPGFKSMGAGRAISKDMVCYWYVIFMG